jgi:hypothetical protein
MSNPSLELSVDQIDHQIALLTHHQLSKSLEIPLQYLPLGIKEGDRVLMSFSSVSEAIIDQNRQRVNTLLQQVARPDQDDDFEL